MTAIIAAPTVMGLVDVLVVVKQGVAVLDPLQPVRGSPINVRATIIMIALPAVPVLRRPAMRDTPLLFSRVVMWSPASGEKPATVPMTVVILRRIRVSVTS